MQAIVFMLLSTLCLAFSGFTAKLLAGSIALDYLLAARLGVPAVIMLSLAYIYRARLPAIGELKTLSKRSIFIALTQFCFFLSLEQLSLIEIAVLFSTGPLFIPVIERVLYGNKISLTIMFTLCFSFFGVLLQSQIFSGVEFRWALLLGLLSGFFNACSQVSMYRASKVNLDPLIINGVTFLIALLLVLPMVALLQIEHNSPLTLEDIFNSSSLLVLLMGALGVGTQLFRTSAYKKAVSSAELAPIIYFNILIAAILQFSFFEETFTLTQLAGLFIISLSCVIYAFANFKRSRSAANKRL